MRISAHSKQRIIERNQEIGNVAAAKREARQAHSQGSSPDKFRKFPKFYDYLLNKASRSNTCYVKVYHNNVYIWRGKKTKTLVTSYPIPKRYQEELGVII